MEDSEPGWIDLEDEEIRRAIVESAVDDGVLERREVHGEQLIFEPGRAKPFTGWMKKARPDLKLVMVAEMEAGDLEGRMVLLREDGSLESISHLENRVPHGATGKWYANGNKEWQGAMGNGASEGMWTFWYEDGQKAKEITFEDGVMEGPFAYWHENGRISARGTFKAGKLDGDLAKWHDNGQREVESFYQDGLLEGEGTYWNREGVVMQREQFRGGEPFVEPSPYLADCPIAGGFVFPVGPPDGRGYYNALPFGEKNHLGEDWNGTGGGNSDLGDPIHAIANGIVFYVGDPGPGWGNVVRLFHNTGTKEEPEHVESLYAHLETVDVSVGDTVKGGQQLGTMGNVDGQYHAHLHLEVRTKIGMGVGGGYSADNEGYVEPTKFIRSRRE